MSTKHSVAASFMSLVALLATVFLPSIQNGQRDWFTTQDVVAWSAKHENVMPIWCTEVQPGTYTSCTVVQAQPLTLVWDNVAGEVVTR